MKIISKIHDIKDIIIQTKAQNKKIGIVPTMGALHRGHISLIKKAVEDCEYVVVSVFVNPTQFGPGEDYKTYPRQIENDIKILQEEKIDVLFLPTPEEMYPKNFETWINVENLSEKFEGKFRPGHFKGVCTVVAKLFHIIQPDQAYFGWKDAQQLIIIKKMVKDLNMPVDIIGMPTLRDNDGMALSSRNIYLSPEGRRKALCLYNSLHKMFKMVKYLGINDADVLLEEGQKIILKEKVNIDYLECVSLLTLEPVKKIKKGTGILGAIRIENIRLLDNMIWE